MLQLRWKSSFSASCLHAAASLYEGLPVGDSRVAKVLEPAVQRLVNELIGSGLEPRLALPALVAYAGDRDNNRQLAEMATRRAFGAVGDEVLSRLAGAIADLEAAWLRYEPRLVEELAVRGRPIREQWEARGPGLLRAVEKLTAEKMIASAAEVVLVSPIVGGHGRADIMTNRVVFEAVLAHPYPDLPETIRLGWLLAQLNLDVPALSESVSGVRLPELASLATLPLVLSAAESVELISSDRGSLAKAIDCWFVGRDESPELAEQLDDWWQAYIDRATPWPVAIAALDAMLSR